MKQNITILLLTFLLLIAGCGGTDTDKQKELDLKEKELALKEKELNLKEKDETNVDAADEKDEADEAPEVIKETKPVKADESSNVDNLVGEWADTDEPSIHMKFTRDGRFEFTDWNSKTEEEEELSGRFELKGGSLTLLYDDRPKQTFKFRKGGNGPNGYSIEKGDYYLVK